MSDTKQDDYTTKDYIDLLNFLRFNKTIKNKKNMIVYRDFLEDELKDEEDLQHLINPRLKCIKTDDISKIPRTINTLYISNNTSNLLEDTTYNSIKERVIHVYKSILERKFVYTKKDKAFCVYIRVLKKTGHYYVGFSRKWPRYRHKDDVLHTIDDICLWTKNASTTLMQDAIIQLILEGKNPEYSFESEVLFSFDTEEDAKAVEKYIIMMSSLGALNLDPEKLLNIQSRTSSRNFTYRDINDNLFTYVKQKNITYKVRHNVSQDTTSSIDEPPKR